MTWTNQGTPTIETTRNMTQPSANNFNGTGTATYSYTLSWDGAAGSGAVSVPLMVFGNDSKGLVQVSVTPVGSGSSLLKESGQMQDGTNITWSSDPDDSPQKAFDDAFTALGSVASTTGGGSLLIQIRLAGYAQDAQIYPSHTAAPYHNCASYSSPLSSICSAYRD